ncbi:MAG TPA: nuclear transport factor 2 family protein [Ktedonobacteraceae bacterium]|jgi:CheY-like chemotaxis protein
MLSASPSTPRLLLVEHDEGIRELLAAFLTSEGYAVSLSTSPAEAYALLDEQTFHLLLTDLFSNTPQDRFEYVDQVRILADPTPVGVLTGWNVGEEAVTQHSLAFLVRKPFDIADLLASIAASLNMPFSPVERRQAHLVQNVVELACTAEWDGVAGLCTEDIVFSDPGTSPLARTLSGKAAFCGHLQEWFSHFPGLRLEKVLVYRRPHGMAARYAIGWRNPDGGTGHLTGALLVEFAGERICRIGVRVNDEHVTAVLARLGQAP